MNDKEISQKRLADLLGTAPGNVNRYLKEKQSPSIDVVGRFAKALDVSLARLLWTSSDDSEDILTRDEIHEIFSTALRIFEGERDKKEIPKGFRSVVKQLGGWKAVHRFLIEETTIREISNRKSVKLRKELLKEIRESESKQSSGTKKKSKKTN